MGMDWNGPSNTPWSNGDGIKIKPWSWENPLNPLQTSTKRALLSLLTVLQLATVWPDVYAADKRDTRFDEKPLEWYDSLWEIINNPNNILVDKIVDNIPWWKVRFLQTKDWKTYCLSTEEKNIEWWTSEICFYVLWKRYYKIWDRYDNIPAIYCVYSDGDDKIFFREVWDEYKFRGMGAVTTVEQVFTLPKTVDRLNAELEKYYNNFQNEEVSTDYEFSEFIKIAKKYEERTWKDLKSGKAFRPIETTLVVRILEEVWFDELKYKRADYEESVINNTLGKWRG